MMSPCDIEQLQLHRLHDGEVLANEASALRGHLATCARCTAGLADLDTLAELLIDQRHEAKLDLPPGFATRVMAALPTDTGRQPWLEALWASFRDHRDGWAVGLIGAALAASLLVVTAPGLRNRDEHAQEAAENEAQIHSLEVSSPDQQAVILQSAEGNTVIWLISPSEGDGDSGVTPSP